MDPGRLVDESRETRVLLLDQVYDRGRVVGRGAFGEAFLVVRKADKKRYVAKELPALNSKDRDVGAREIEMLKRASGHPNIVRYVDHFESPEVIHLVMEYASGGTLRACLADRKAIGRFREEKITTWFTQLILALKHLHECSILHRDIKPANIFFTGKGIVKLGDFGLTKLVEGTMQQANTACGTPHYFSPEICERVAYGSKSDMWAAGCMLYEMMMLQHPFVARTLKALQVTIVNLRFTTPIDDEYSEPLCTIAKRLLAKSPTERLSAIEVLRQPVIAAHLRRYLKYVDELGLDLPKEGYQAPPVRQRTEEVRDAPSASSWHTATLNSGRPGQESLRQDIAQLRSALRKREQQQQRDESPPPPPPQPERQPPEPPQPPANASLRLVQQTAPAQVSAIPSPDEEPDRASPRSGSRQSSGSKPSGDAASADPAEPPQRTSPRIPTPPGTRRGSAGSPRKRSGSGRRRRRSGSVGSGDSTGSKGRRGRSSGQGNPPKPGRLQSAAGSGMGAVQLKRRLEEEGKGSPANRRSDAASDASLPSDGGAAADITADEQKEFEAEEDAHHSELLTSLRELAASAPEQGGRIDADAVAAFAGTLPEERRVVVLQLLGELPYTPASPVDIERRCVVFDSMMTALGPVGSVRLHSAMHRLVFAGTPTFFG